VISTFNNSHGPDILGVCEVENRKVVLQLSDAIKAKVNRNYAVVHEESDDKRGIDVSFIYDQDMFEVERGKVFSHSILRREATRNIVQVNFKSISKGNYLIVIGNHWPSRSGGEAETEPYRIVAGESLNYFHRRILQELGDETAVVAMGDFNDEPFNISIKDYLKASIYRKRLQLDTGKKSPIFYDLMSPLIGKGLATFVFTEFGTNSIFPNMLDHFLVSKSIVNGTLFSVKEDLVSIIKRPEMYEGQFEAPIKFGRPNDRSGVNIEGYSDHFPVSLVLTEK
jgi:hypothetical protein